MSAEEVVAKLLERWQCEGFRTPLPMWCRRQLVRAVQDAADDARLEEREACARMIQGFKTGGPHPDIVTWWGEGLAEAIRRRGKDGA